MDRRSDIYSLSVVMFELLTGHPSFRVDNVSALLHAVEFAEELRSCFEKLAA